MPKPPATYLPTQQPGRVAQQAAQARQDVAAAQAAQRVRLAAAFARAKVDPRKLEQMRRLAESLKQAGKEPSSAPDRARKALAELVEQLGDLAEQLGKQKELAAEIAAPARSYLSATRPFKPDGANAAQAAMAAVVFLLVLQKLWARLSGAR